MWQAVEPPECAVAIHDDVVAMYANLGDISAFGLYLKVVDPESNSGQRLTQEAIVRTGESIEATAAGLSEVSGIEVDVQAALDSLMPISERIAEGD